MTHSRLLIAGRGIDPVSRAPQPQHLVGGVQDAEELPSVRAGIPVAMGLVRRKAAPDLARWCRQEGKKDRAPRDSPRKRSTVHGIAATSGSYLSPAMTGIGIAGSKTNELGLK